MQCSAFFEWGDAACWSTSRIYELCCFPNPRDVGQGQSVIVEDGFLPCWKAGFNASRCCRPHNLLVQRPGLAAPSALRSSFRGCSGSRWQAFLFKFRIAAGTLWFFCKTVTCWFEYWGLRIGISQTSVTRPDEGGCPIGHTLRFIALEFSGGRSGAGSVRKPNISGAVAELRQLEKAFDAHNSGMGLFLATGVALSQFKYLEYLQGVSVPESLADEVVPVSLKLRRASRTKPACAGAPLVLDFGMSGGVDVEFYLSSGFRVAAVEANKGFVQAVSRRLHAFIRAGRLSVLHAAVGGDPKGRAAEFVDFYLDDHQVEKSALYADGQQPQGDFTRTVVPRYSCGGVYVTAAAQIAATADQPQGAEYAKIDLEGQDFACLRSLLRSSSRCGWASLMSGTFCERKATAVPVAPPPPRFVSVELSLGNQTDAAALANRYHLILRGWYCAAKLSRQALYNSRLTMGSRTGFAMLMSRLGLGSSGPFGDAAVDWRFGVVWRPLPDVLHELGFAAVLMQRAPGEWFDLHLRRCGQRLPG